MMEDMPRTGRPSTSATQVNIAKVKEIEKGTGLFVSHILIRDHTENKAYYLGVEKGKIRDKEILDFTPRNTYLHKTITANEILTTNLTNTIKQPKVVGSQELTPVDFFPFPNLILSLRGTDFNSVEN